MSAKPDWALNEPPFVYETYLWCNERREADGKPPLDRLPRGTHSGYECPCGQATDLYVSGGTLAWRRRPGGYTHFDLPDAVRAFVKAFDNGQLPQYEVDKPGGAS